MKWEALLRGGKYSSGKEEWEGREAVVVRQRGRRRSLVCGHAAAALPNPMSPMYQERKNVGIRQARRQKGKTEGKYYEKRMQWRGERSNMSLECSMKYRTHMMNSEK